MSVSYKDFKPVAQVFFDPTVIYTSANSKFETFEDIVNHAKANPGQQTWGAGNPGSAETMCIEKIAQLADMKITVVPFEGGHGNGGISRRIAKAADTACDRRGQKENNGYDQCSAKAFS